MIEVRLALACCSSMYICNVRFGFSYDSFSRIPSLSELEEHSLQQFTLVGDSLLLVKLLQRIYHCLDVLTVKLDGVEEV